MGNNNRNDDLVVVNAYPDAFSAEVAKGVLESAGIPCFIQSEAVSSAYPVWMPELMVRKSDLNTACALLGITLRRN